MKKLILLLSFALFSYSAFAQPIAVRATNGTSYFQTLNNSSNNNVNLPGSTNELGVVYKWGTNFLHNYSTNTALGGNTFLGLSSGNFTNGPAGGANTLASFNTGIGSLSLQRLSTGYDNSALGASSLKTTTSGYRNTAIGYEAMSLNTTGYENFAGGQRALQNNLGGHANTASGVGALQANTSGNFNTASGQGALGTANTASDNAAFGYNSLNANITGTRDAAFGAYSARFATGNDIAAFGYFALGALTTGNSNTAFGSTAAQQSTTASNVTAVGANALYNNTSGNYNSGLGADTLKYLTTGIQVSALGSQAGYNPSNDIAQYRIIADRQVTLLGSGATKDNTITLTNIIAVGHEAKVLTNNQVVLGNDAITTTLLKGNVGIGTVSPATMLDVAQTGTFGNGIVETNLTVTNILSVIKGVLNVGDGSSVADATLTLNGTAGGSTVIQKATANKWAYGTDVGVANDDLNFYNYSAASTVLRLQDTTGIMTVTKGLQIGPGTTITNIVSATAALDFGSILAAASADLTITVAGAKVNDSVYPGPPADPDASLTFDYFVSAANTVTVRAHNVGSIAVDQASKTWRVTVQQF